MTHRLQEYQPPEWAQSLKLIPKYRVQLAAPGVTPITEWKLPDAPEDFKVLLKRDDYTGSVLTGNKVRQLEFIIADAIAKGHKHIITAGAVHSNHCRAVAASCAELGLQSHLFLRTPAKQVSDLKFDGNLFLDRLFGANFYLVPADADYVEFIEVKMQELAEQIEKEKGETSHLICANGSKDMGMWGYIQCFEDIRHQGVEFDDILCACGGGRTICGLAVANYLCGMPYRLHTIVVSKLKRDNYRKIVQDHLNEVGLQDVAVEDVVTLYFNQVTPEHGENLPSQLELMVKSAEQTGVVLDNIYTAKAANELKELMQNKPEVFKGNRILFLHTGGLPSLQSEAKINPLLPYLTRSKFTFVS